MDEALPFFLPSAFKRLRHSQIMRQYFGDAYIDVYAETKLLEYEKFQRMISSAEYDWYL